MYGLLLQDQTCRALRVLEFRVFSVWGLGVSVHTYMYMYTPLNPKPRTLNHIHACIYQRRFRVRELRFASLGIRVQGCSAFRAFTVGGLELVV